MPSHGLRISRPSSTASLRTIRRMPSAFSIVGTPFPASTKSSTHALTSGGDTFVNWRSAHLPATCARDVCCLVALVVSAMSAGREGRICTRCPAASAMGVPPTQGSSCWHCRHGVPVVPLRMLGTTGTARDTRTHRTGCYRVSAVRFCRYVRSSCGCSFGGGDVSVHRHRGFDSSVGGRRRRDAACAGRPRSGVA